MLDIIQLFMDYLQHEFVRLDGSTPVKVTQRAFLFPHKLIINNFIIRIGSRLSIISMKILASLYFCYLLKLGVCYHTLYPYFLTNMRTDFPKIGLGINLTSADTVIFYDLCFNPQVDRQAEDRYLASLFCISITYP